MDQSTIGHGIRRPTFSVPVLLLVVLRTLWPYLTISRRTLVGFRGIVSGLDTPPGRAMLVDGHDPRTMQVAILCHTRSDWRRLSPETSHTTSPWHFAQTQPCVLTPLFFTRSHDTMMSGHARIHRLAACSTSYAWANCKCSQVLCMVV